ncbi:MAG TPA: Ig-like domain-containing protein, partial [Gemmatimonadales bacterium]
MQRLRNRAWTLIAPMFAAMIVASCAQEDNFGPRLATLTAVSGSGQFAAVGSTLAQPLVVRVRDQTGAAVEGAVVQWQITSTSPGAEVTPSQSLTDATGQAQASLRLGSTLGVVTVVALLGEQEETFTATATTAPPAHLLVVSGDNQSGT